MIDLLIKRPAVRCIKSNLTHALRDRNRRARLLTDCDRINGFNALDIDINQPDHVPILAICACDVSPTQLYGDLTSESSPDVSHTRWAHARLESYYEHTRQLCVPVLKSPDSLFAGTDASTDLFIVDGVNHYYNSLVNISRKSTHIFLPKHKKNFYELWWSQELGQLRQTAIALSGA
jgi:hypothetical protein